MGPLSAPAGKRVTPQGARGHEKCQDREKCTGPGCRVRTGKTAHKRAGIVRTKPDPTGAAHLIETEDAA